jgi:large subunit ribosomal protein L25
MKLTVNAREGETKSAIKQVRRQGNIPGIIYAPGQTPESVVVDGTEFATAMRGIKPGQLPTTVFTLAGGKKERKAILKEIQYAITTYQVSHLDFEELKDDVKVQVKVPITLTGASDCIGVKLGGFLRQVVRFIEVECLPKHLPKEFEVDVRDLGITQVKRLSDLSMPTHVRPLANMEEVIVVVAKR